MIGRRAALLGAVAISLAGSAVGIGAQGLAADAAARDARLRSLALVADEALDALEAELRAALDAGRRGSARVVAGDEPPGVELEAAAAGVATAGPEAAAAAEALATLEGTTRALDRPGSPMAPTTPAELVSIAAQLRGTVDAANEFAAMRHRTAEALHALDGALAALDRGDVSTARDEVGAARDLLEILVAWEPGLVTLPIWLETTTQLVDAVERLVLAVEAGDVEAARQAQQAFEAASPDAREADVALQIALSEGGGAVADAPLRRLAAALRLTTEARAALASILHPPASAIP